MRPPHGNTPARELTAYGQGRAVRWERCDYVGNIDIHVTICAAKDVLFRDQALARMICENVEFYCRKLGYRLYGYALMPDHLHVLLSPADSGEPLSHWLDVFKSYTTHQYMKSGERPPLWQSSANDHVCREGETAETVMRYIADNPVRAGLVEKWQDWPWTKVFIEV
jgi:REP element-mobilizing transposase RayT